MGSLRQWSVPVESVDVWANAEQWLFEEVSAAAVFLSPAEFLVALSSISICEKNGT
jgi:hypothetical protein